MSAMKESLSDRLEALRAALRAENISWGELDELQSLAAYIDPSDVELLEAAGVPEFGEENCTVLTGSAWAIGGGTHCRHVCAQPAQHDSSHVCECGAAWVGASE